MGHPLSPRCGLQEGGYEGEGQAYDVEVAAFDAGNPPGGVALDGVGSGFVGGLAGGDVVADFLFGEGEELDCCYFGSYFGARGTDDGYAGDDAVGATGEEAEHSGGVFVVFRFAEDVIVEGNGGVCA
jgi:hypothetical protein